MFVFSPGPEDEDTELLGLDEGADAREAAELLGLDGDDPLPPADEL